MTNTNRIIILISLAALLLWSNFSIGDDSSDSEQARAVIDNYMSALVSGDTDTIIDLLGGHFLVQRRQILNNVEYSNLLQERYQSLRYEIATETVLSGSRWAFKTHLYFGNEDQMTLLLTIKKSDHQDEVIYEIIDEKTIN